MTPSHATKPGKRYRYYVTRSDQLDDAPAWRVSAHDLERLVCDRRSEQITDQRFLCDLAKVHPLKSFSKCWQRPISLRQRCVAALRKRDMT